MVKLQHTYAIGCLIQWYEIEMVEEYLQSLRNALDTLENPKNVKIDLYFNVDQSLEKVDEDKIHMADICEKYRTLVFKYLEPAELDMPDYAIYGGDSKFVVDMNPEFVSGEIYTIADYRRDFNNKYCNKVDVLLWGESDCLIPRQSFEILDNLHASVKEQTPKYVATFGICKMWDKSWEILEHPEFTVKPFIDNDYDNWWSLKYTMNNDEMNEFNDKVTELDVQTTTDYKFNGCFLIMSSDVVKSGINIPNGMFFVHEDTSFLHVMAKMFGNTIPQYVIKNILVVHNRNHPKKRMYVKGEKGGTMNEKRRSNDWYTKANKMSEHNAYNLFNQAKTYGWDDVFRE